MENVKNEQTEQGKQGNPTPCTVSEGLSQRIESYTGPEGFAQRSGPLEMWTASEVRHEAFSNVEREAIFSIGCCAIRECLDEVAPPWDGPSRMTADHFRLCCEIPSCLSLFEVATAAPNVCLTNLQAMTDMVLLAPRCERVCEVHKPWSIKQK